MSPDGRRLVFSFSHRRWHLYIAGDAGEPARHVLATPGVQAASLSPTGTRIALAQGAEAQSPAVSILDLTTMDRRTVSGMAASSISWMPDGKSLLMAAPAPDGSIDWIWRLPLGGGLPEPILTGASHWRAPIPSPTGTTVGATRRSASGWELVIRDLERGEEKIVARKAVIEAPRWSADGKWLAWSGSQRPEDVDSGGIWVCEVSAGTPRRLALDGAWPVWEGDDKHLLFGRFLHQRGIWRVSLDGGPPALVRTLDPEMEDLYLEGLDVGSSGSPVLFILAQYTGELYSMEAPSNS
jgi:Tol biopolymer transport system component